MAAKPATITVAVPKSTTFSTESVLPKGALPSAQSPSSPAVTNPAGQVKVGNIIGSGSSASNKWFKDGLGNKVSKNMSGTKQRISQIVDSFSASGKKYTLIKKGKDYAIKTSKSFDVMASPSKMSKAMPKDLAFKTFAKLKKENIKVKF